MSTPQLWAKAVSLLCIAWAHAYISTPPSAGPPVRPHEGRRYETSTKFVSQIRPEWVRTFSRWAVRTLVFCEVTAIFLAQQFSATSPMFSTCTARLTPSFVLAWLLVAAGAAVRAASYRAMRGQFTFALTIRADHRLVTTGPYAFVRHPSYTGYIMVALGALACLLGPGSWFSECGAAGTTFGRAFAVVWGAEMLWMPVVMVVFRVAAEDEVLHGVFEKEWEAWAARVRYRLIPGVY